MVAHGCYSVKHVMFLAGQITLIQAALNVFLAKQHPRRVSSSFKIFR